MGAINLMHDEIEELENYREFCLGMESERPARIVVDGNPSHFTEQAEWADRRLKELTRPKRIQRKRTKGYDMQAESKALNGLEAVSVTRPGRYGNPFVIGKVSPLTGGLITLENCLGAFEAYAYRKMQLEGNWIEPLRGKNLACFCKEGAACHGDVLLRYANPVEATTR